MGITITHIKPTVTSTMGLFRQNYFIHKYKYSLTAFYVQCSWWSPTFPLEKFERSDSFMEYIKASTITYKSKVRHRESLRLRLYSFISPKGGYVVCTVEINQCFIQRHVKVNLSSLLHPQVKILITFVRWREGGVPSNDHLGRTHVGPIHNCMYFYLLQQSAH